MRPNLVLFALLLCPLSLWAKDGEIQIVPGKPCDVIVSLLEPSPKDEISFWGKVLEIKEVDGLPGGQEIVFEPKTTHKGAKLKRVKVFMKRSICRMDLKVDSHSKVYINEKGEGTLYSVIFDRQKKLKKSKKYPHFEPEILPCEGFDSKFGFTSADLFTLATVVEIQKDLKEDMEIIVFKPKRVWNGPLIETFKVLQKIDDTCSIRFSKGGGYDLFLNSADQQYYYHDCCNGVMGPVSPDYEKRFSPIYEEFRKKFLGK